MKWQRGDVVLCRVPMPSTQLQQFKLRPAVIISADRLNQVLDDLMVVPCTSNTNRNLAAIHYPIAGDEIINAGIRVKSMVQWLTNRLCIVEYVERWLGIKPLLTHLAELRIVEIHSLSWQIGDRFPE